MADSGGDGEQEKSWNFGIGGSNLIFFSTSKKVRVALEKDTLDVWLNGLKIETESGFTEDGSEITFQIGNRAARIIGFCFFLNNGDS